MCNGDNDCLDFSDELACPATTATTVTKKKKSPPPAPPPLPPLPMTTSTMTSTPQPCAHNDFRCANNERCIWRSFVCDGFDNCGDYSDESACSTTLPTTPVSKCPPSITVRGYEVSVVSCATSRKCILSSQVCDGDNDCGDNSDERECEKTCSWYQFRCRNERCVSRGRVCDDVNNCGDYSDELNCPTPVPPQTFQCRNGDIILKSQQCDGHDDCDNDEDDCGSKRNIGGTWAHFILYIIISDFCLEYGVRPLQIVFIIFTSCVFLAMIVSVLCVSFH